MITSLMPVPKQQYFNIAGLPLVGGNVYTYGAGTNIPKDTFTDSAGTVPQPNPIPLNGRGEPTNAIYWAGAYKVVVEDALGNIVYTVDNYNTDPAGVWDIFTTLLSAAGSAAIGYIRTAANAILRTLHDKAEEFVSVADFVGFDPTGATDSTAAVQAAITYAETFSRAAPMEVFFPPGCIVRMKMGFIATGGIKLNGNGCTIIQCHDNVNSTVVGGAGEYKISAAFFIKRGAANIEIMNFDFTQDVATFPVLAAGFGSYMPSIGGQHYDGLNVHHCRFRGGFPRAVFTQAGKRFTFTENKCENVGITNHVGYTANIYFYDATADITNKYSPSHTQIVRNEFKEYNNTSPSICLHLTGAIHFVVRDNYFREMNAATTTAIRLYSNDYGPYDENGVALGIIDGICEGNTINGTFLNAIQVDGNSSVATAAWTSSLKFHVNVANNKITGTGHGIRMGECVNLRVTGNHVAVTGSPCYFELRIVYVDVLSNYFECTLSGYDSTTIYGGWAAGSGGLTFNNNRVVSPTGSQYAFRTTVAMLWLTMISNNIYYASTVVAGRAVVLTLSGKAQIRNNVFNIETTIVNCVVMVLAGSGTVATLDLEANDMVANTAFAGTPTLQFVNPYNFNVVRIVGNMVVGAITVETSYRTYVRENTIYLPVGNTRRAVYCDNAGLAQRALVEIHENYINQNAINSPLIGINSNNDATLNTIAKVAMNQLIGNSTTVLLQQTNAGTLEYIGNSITNAGAGGVAPGVTGTAVATAL